MQENSVVYKVLRVGNVNLHYSVRGETNDSTPLVFLHGWCGAGEDWRHLMPELDQSQQAYYLDAAGFGKSQFETPLEAQAANYSLQRYEQDLLAVLDHEKLQQVHLIGHSWGSVVAMCFAAHHPERVTSLCAIGAAYFDPTNKIHLSFKWVSYGIAKVLVAAKKPLLGSARLRRIAARRYFFTAPDPVAADELLATVIASDNHALIQTLLESYQVNFEDICPKIACPTLYIGCDRDAVAMPGFVRAFVPLTPNSSYFLMDNSGHFPMIEQPQALLKLLQAFWQNTPQAITS